MYRPKELAQLDSALRLLIPTEKTYNGVKKKVYPDKNDSGSPLFFANFKTFGGTETTINDTYSILDTAQVVTWFRPDISADCRIVRLNDMAVFEIVGEPENIDNRNMILSFKVQRVKGI